MQQKDNGKSGCVLSVGEEGRKDLHTNGHTTICAKLLMHSYAYMHTDKNRAGPATHLHHKVSDGDREEDEHRKRQSKLSLARGARGQVAAVAATATG